MKPIISLIIITLLFSQPVSAQFNKLKEKLNEKISEVTKEEVKEKRKDKKPMFDLGKMMGSSDMELEESYSYNFKIDWKVNSDDMKEPMNMAQLFSTENNYFGMEVENNDPGQEWEKFYGIIDFNRNYFITLNEEEGQAMVFEFENLDAQVEEQKENEQPKEFNITKTSETQMIAGYSCTKYLYNGDDGKGEMWTTTQLDYKNFDMFSYFQKLNQKHDIKQNTVYNSGVEGFILKIDGVDENGETFFMEAQKVDENADVSYQMNEYQVIDLTGLSKGLGGFKNE